ncbi:MAG: GAF domain-containing protein [Thermoplasmata archaeon]|nr:GAF domain-containing protein [Thermoplasmata archaeon]
MEELLQEIKEVVKEKGGRDEKLLKICKILSKIPHYNWVGFYIADNEKKELHLSSFVGEPTEHKRIPFGKGICGRVAEEQKTLVIQDVSKENNYLACSLKVKAEIVVPIFKNGEFVAELDIDSHQLAPFGEEDKKFLEKVAGMVAEIF